MTYRVTVVGAELSFSLPRANDQHNCVKSKWPRQSMVWTKKPNEEVKDWSGQVSQKKNSSMIVDDGKPT